jgi:hypothetical protein
MVSINIDDLPYELDSTSDPHSSYRTPRKPSLRTTTRFRTMKSDKLLYKEGNHNPYRTPRKPSLRTTTRFRTMKCDNLLYEEGNQIAIYIDQICINYPAPLNLAKCLKQMSNDTCFASTVPFNSSSIRNNPNESFFFDPDQSLQSLTDENIDKWIIFT